ncbi:unnamed protein product [Macrosiphum euphorbiae]|uniref:PHD-type domain-containing protein n=1 Tax=Macrosiphum euphorbiae TaxID=13131 RepID=A0AAV0XQU0_9HEMI|nr:unnamed protein product [Macrosiphum euphorbiae]
MQCTKCNCSLDDSNLVKCVKCQNSLHIACTSLSSLSGDSLKNRVSSWLCSTCEAAKLGVKKTTLHTLSDMDYSTNIDHILTAVNEIKSTLSKHEEFFVKLNRKIDDVSNVAPPHLKIK